MTWSGVWEAARGLYSIALVVSLLLVARFAPAGLRAVNKLADAMVSGADAIRGATVSAETVARLDRKVDEILETLRHKG